MSKQYSQMELVEAIVETSCLWRQKIQQLGREGVLTAEQVKTILASRNPFTDPLPDQTASETNGAPRNG